MGNIAVYGAYGHTGRFVVTELRERGHVPILLGRDEKKLRAMDPEARPATLDDLDRAEAVINTAGPFACTAGPVIEAALRAHIPYVDVAAEIEANADMFAHFAKPARAAGIVVVPAMAFFGGLGDLLVTAALSKPTAATADRTAASNDHAAAPGKPTAAPGEPIDADEVHIAYGLSSWHPTPGTIAAGEVSTRRRAGRRIRFTGGQLQYHDDPLPTLEWPFPPPLGPRSVLGDFTMADVVTIPSHLAVREVRTYMTAQAAKDLAAGDERGRTPETFVVDVLVRAGGTERRITATGRDIYAVTAPLAVEAVERILTGRVRSTGVLSAGAAFDAPDFLRALSDRLTLQVNEGRKGTWARARGGRGQRR
ncbi:saccharopine dehydrogenase NADP-binding domain-containing protein [Actinoplanes sp. LDG1-01]|uniref:Saccharopine dehydrogenase NADP-binding domain-containing protein n=2 Tax=Paractinoplanes lichenicola TaxID=2802976 RepID=A0ABS1VVW1_9ACTN|nr:saccharopine dehydrogenase NADP-binding domain-containing protein [Actinoplanes lichenicola]